jgi:exonuclease III
MNYNWQTKTIRVATLNINGMTTPTRITMLEEFLQTWKINILLIQEVTQQVFHDLEGYNTQYIIRTTRRRTAMIARNGITMTNKKRLPSGRAIAARFRDLGLLNEYAPSGTARRQERETFYTSELPYTGVPGGMCQTSGGCSLC